MVQDNKKVQIMSKAEAKKLVNRGEARYLSREIFSSAEKLAPTSDLETTLQTFATQHRADILVEVKDRSRCGNVSDCNNTIYELYKLTNAQSRVY